MPGFRRATLVAVAAPTLVAVPASPGAPASLQGPGGDPSITEDEIALTVTDGRMDEQTATLDVSVFTPSTDAYSVAVDPAAPPVLFLPLSQEVSAGPPAAGGMGGTGSSGSAGAGSPGTVATATGARLPATGAPEATGAALVLLALAVVGRRLVGAGRRR